MPFATLNSVEEIAHEFQLGAVINPPEPNNSGNESFKLVTEKGAYQVKSYIKSVDDPEHFAPLIQREIAYTKYLGANGFVVQQQLAFQPFHYQGKLATITTFIEGDKLSSGIQTKETISNVGELLGNLHNKSAEYGNAGAAYEQRNSFRDRVDANLLQIEQLLGIPTNEFLLLLDLYQDLRIKRQVSDLTIPRGLTHGELTYVHLLRVNEHNIAILDFEGLKFTPHIFDFGQTLTTMTFDGTRLHQELISAFFEGYQRIRQLSENELKLIPTELIYNYLHKLEWRMTAMLNNAGYIDSVKSNIQNAKSFMEQAEKLEI